jgi:hypothetical protein
MERGDMLVDFDRMIQKGPYRTPRHRWKSYVEMYIQKIDFIWLRRGATGRFL